MTTDVRDAEIRAEIRAEFQAMVQNVIETTNRSSADEPVKIFVAQLLTAVLEWAHATLEPGRPRPRL